MRPPFSTGVLLPLLAGCVASSGPMLGIVSPDSIESRYLRLRNTSKGYVVYRVTAPGASPLVPPVLPPGAESLVEVGTQFGTLCPESLRVEVAAYARAFPDRSPLEDETLEARPCASIAVDLQSARHYGCVADPGWVSLGSTIDCDIVEVDESAGSIGFEFAWLPPQRRAGLELSDPPVPVPGDSFPLRGRLVNLDGQGVPGVEIRLPQLDVSIQTDASGRFSILRPAGTYLLEPNLPGLEISPLVHSFSHVVPDEVPIEFIVLTDAVPAGGGGS